MLRDVHQMDIEDLRGSLGVIYVETSGEFYLLYSFFCSQTQNTPVSVAVLVLAQPIFVFPLKVLRWA